MSIFDGRATRAMRADIAEHKAKKAAAANVMPLDPAVQEMIQPGKSVRMLFGYATKTPRSELWHIRAIVDGRQVVYRVWRGNRWRYGVEDIVRFQMAWADGGMKPA